MQRNRRRRFALSLLLCLFLAGCTNRAGDRPTAAESSGSMDAREAQTSGIQGSSGKTDEKERTDLSGQNDTGKWTFRSMEELDRELGITEPYSYADLRSAVDENTALPEEYREYLHRFIGNMEKKYPKLPLTIFYRNIRDLQTAVVDGQTMKEMRGSASLAGYYNAQRNLLTLNRDRDEDLGEYVIYHEIGHMVNNYRFRYRLRDCSFDFAPEGYGMIFEEALDCLFTEDVMDMQTEGMSYRIAANHLEILMEAYDLNLEDLLEITVYDLLAEAADSLEAEQVRAEDYLAAVNAQRKAVHRIGTAEAEADSLHADAWKVTAHAFFAKKIHKGMSKEELRKLYDAFVEKMTKGLDTGNDRYELDLQPAAEVFETVMKEKGIEERDRPAATKLLTGNTK
ncbi:MAG: hypothetical protein Q4B22_11980 [Eubacteriales bacterium]|nr:hypothetical protein [Eubacteriales bacterium]